MKNISEIIDIKAYNFLKIEIMGSQFALYGRKEGGFGLEKLQHSFKRMAPYFLNYFESKVE